MTPRKGMFRGAVAFAAVLAVAAAEGPPSRAVVIAEAAYASGVRAVYGETWSHSGTLGAGRGAGFCLYAAEARDRPTAVRVVVRRAAAAGPAAAFRLRGARDHAYAMAFALDGERDLAARADGSPAIASRRKLRLDAAKNASDELVLEGVALEPGGSLHVYVASNRLEGECSYVVTAESSDRLEAAPEPAGGWRGRPPAEATAAEAPAATAARLLCVDGGGARGVVPLAVLAECERASGCRARSLFDVVAGTSTGAIVAAGLALAELPVAAIQRLYDDLVRLIFGSGGLTPATRASRLEAVLEAVFGRASTLDGARGAGGARLVVVATDASTARLRPFVFRSFAPPEGDDGDYLVDAHAHRCGVVDAIMASTAAPPLFPMRRFDVDGAPRRLLDGALVANNPTQFALAEAAALRRAAAGAALGGAADGALDLVVSLGTGAAPARAVASATEARTFLSAIPQSVAAAREFVAGIVNLITDTDATSDLVRRQLRETWSGDDLARRYHRLDAVVDARSLRLDEGDVDVLRDLRAMALDYIKRDKAAEWRALTSALRRRAGGDRGRPDARTYAVVDLDDAPDDAPPPPKTLARASYGVRRGLRPLRKRAAQITGAHGFFSGKKR